MWNDLFFLNEADDDEEKKKNKDEDEKEEDKDEKEDSEKEKSDDSDDEEYNDLIDDDDDSDDKEDDITTDSSDDFNDLDASSDEDFSSDDDDISDDSSSDDEYNTLVVVKTDSDDSSSCGSLYDKAAKVAYAYTVIANNMRHIHINACGNNFEDIHQTTDSVHCHFNYASDYFYELAAESPLVELDNPTRAKEHCEDIEVETNKDYDFKTAFEAIDRNLNYAIKYLSELRDCADSRKDVQSKIDEELGYINKQSKYVIRKKLYEPTPDTSDSMIESYSYNDLF